MLRALTKKQRDLDDEISRGKLADHLQFLVRFIFDIPAHADFVDSLLYLRRLQLRPSILREISFFGHTILKPLRAQSHGKKFSEMSHMKVNIGKGHTDCPQAPSRQSGKTTAQTRARTYHLWTTPTSTIALRDAQTLTLGRKTPYLSRHPH